MNISELIKFLETATKDEVQKLKKFIFSLPTESQ